uniref:Putative DNA binding, helix-turn-helix domain containing protein n=1 Tax=viral metagenome TaxID=1070528 RepID=A0A6M3KVQ9_9ZZZZ
MNKKKVTSKERIFEFIITNFMQEFTNKELSKELGIKLGTVTSIVSYLNSAAVLNSIGRGSYCLDGEYTYNEIDKIYKNEVRLRNKGNGLKKKRVNKYKRKEEQKFELSPIELGEKLFLYIESLRDKVKRCEEMEVDNKFLVTESFKLQERIRELTEQINVFNRPKKLF